MYIQVNPAIILKNQKRDLIIYMVLQKVWVKLKTIIFYNKILNIGGKKISKYKLLFLVSKIFKKKIKIIKYSSFKIDRSLNSNKFLKISNYKVKSWIIMLKQLKKFMILNNFKF